MTKQFCGRTRREFLWEAGGGFTGLALTGLLSADGFLANQAVAADGKSKFVNPMAPKKPHFDGKAKSVIFIFCYGGPSHIDTFDEKPSMYSLDGKTITVVALKDLAMSHDEGTAANDMSRKTRTWKCGNRGGEPRPPVAKKAPPAQKAPAQKAATAPAKAAAR